MTRDHCTISAVFMLESYSHLQVLWSEYKTKHAISVNKDEGRRILLIRLWARHQREEKGESAAGHVGKKNAVTILFVNQQVPHMEHFFLESALGIFEQLPGEFVVLVVAMKTTGLNFSTAYGLNFPSPVGAAWAGEKSGRRSSDDGYQFQSQADKIILCSTACMTLVVVFFLVYRRIPCITDLCSQRNFEFVKPFTFGVVEWTTDGIPRERRGQLWRMWLEPALLVQLNNRAVANRILIRGFLPAYKRMLPPLGLVARSVRWMKGKGQGRPEEWGYGQVLVTTAATCASEITSIGLYYSRDVGALLRHPPTPPPPLAPTIMIPLNCPPASVADGVYRRGRRGHILLASSDVTDRPVVLLDSLTADPTTFDHLTNLQEIRGPHPMLPVLEEQTMNNTLWLEYTQDYVAQDEQQYFEVMRRARNFRQRVNMGFVSLFEFNERCHMSSVKLEPLLLEIGHLLEHPTLRNKATFAKEQMLVSLRWLGNEGQYQCVCDMHGISKATVVQQFHALAGILLVCDCVDDGTLIPMDAPNEYEAHCVDRNGNHSMNCMVVCGPTHQIYYVSANWPPGSIHDSRVLRNSTFDIDWRPCPNTVVLGDSGYPLKDWLIVPAHNEVATPAVHRFNRAHKSTRRIVENSLGILKEKFSCLNYLRVQPTFVANIFKRCVALCNFSRDANEDVGLPDGRERSRDIGLSATYGGSPLCISALSSDYYSVPDTLFHSLEWDREREANDAEQQSCNNIDARA
ncbi:hypothetical protein PR048_005583 [Dryococelus australis]|uniref:DDE Tnp4 domain-containing protein n=1 Tax=Dryococelus australis TaxID=614101 RepID=A0ABQ9I965_9NEOP|nr:hypothetical protein PR048_005583 [Dryococelus australis]